TPVLYQPPVGASQVLIAGSHRLTSYDVATGKELWWVRGLPWQIKTTPVIDGDVVYFSGWSAETNPGEQEIVPDWSEALAKYDRNKDGRLAKDEIPDRRGQVRFYEHLDHARTGPLEGRHGERAQARP